MRFIPPRVDLTNREKVGLVWGWPPVKTSLMHTKAEFASKAALELAPRSSFACQSLATLKQQLEENSSSIFTLMFRALSYEAQKKPAMVMAGFSVRTFVGRGLFDLE